MQMLDINIIILQQYVYVGHCTKSLGYTLYVVVCSKEGLLNEILIQR